MESWLKSIMSHGDGEMGAVPVIKKEVELSGFHAPSSPSSTVYSPTITIPPSDLKFCETSGFSSEIQCSPGSPDHQYCSSTTHSLSNPVVQQMGEEMKEEEDMPRRLCLVCGDIASGFHYGVASCEACKAFFKRTIQGNIEYTCPGANDCEINKRRRKACQACRFQKCLNKGMLKEGVRLDRVRGGRQKYRRNTEVSYLSSTHPNKPLLEDNKLLEILIGCEPEVLSILSEEDSCRAQGVSTLKILSDLYDKELVNIIGWAKQIPGFTELSLPNQMRLLQSTWTEILTLSLAFRSLPPTGKLNFAVDFILDEMLARECGAIEIYHLCLTVMDKLQRSLICKEEYILLKALVLANSDARVDEASALKHLRDSIVSSLMDCVAVIRGDRSETATVLLCLPVLRQADHVLRTFWTGLLARETRQGAAHKAAEKKKM
ncbi:estrogen-related receptor isoform X2 [Rhodnius prolixus]|uniref:estrogen-related receptor isoform X2 n=1 Tax=Rhodnius prolixus TaxID=13249 RepID=UPI003D18AF78